MTVIVWIGLLCLGSGLAIPLGAFLASFDSIKPNWLKNETRHSILAFGGGALISAVALVLVPQGMETLDLIPAALSFLGGGIFFLYLDLIIQKSGSSLSNLLAMMSDFIPEALALGAMYATDSSSAGLLALLIFVQNIPEGFNSFRELVESSSLGKTKIFLTLFALAWLGPVMGVSGHLWFSNLPQTTGAIKLIAAGGILFLVFQDIAPQAALKNQWAPSLGAVAGFLVGMIGEKLLG